MLEKRETEIVLLGMKNLLSQNTNITIHVKQLVKLIMRAQNIKYKWQKIKHSKTY